MAHTDGTISDPNELTKGSNATRTRICEECGMDIPSELKECPHDGLDKTSIQKAEELVGKTLADNYLIVGLIGMGGMSAVYRARHQILGRTVAIKIMHAHLMSHTSSLKRFEQEAKAVSHLNHPNIVAVHEYGITPEGQPYLIMDYLEGTSLSQVIKDGQKIPVERALPIFLQICDALDHAHDKGIIHRDMKPSNVVLVEFQGEKDFVKLVDFGIAKLLPGAEIEGVRLTQTGEVFGSPVYMSPEQCMGQKLDARSDIYSVGCLMYEMLCGQPPYIGQNIMETLYMRLTDSPPPFDPELKISKSLESIIMLTLAREPEQRYQTMKELRLELERSPYGGDNTIAGRLRALQRSQKASRLKSQRPLALDLAVIVAAIVAVGLVVGAWLQFGHGASAREGTWRQLDQTGQKLLDQGDLPGAEKLFNQAVKEAENFGEQDQRLADSLKKLASTYRAEKKDALADATEQRLVSIQEISQYGNDAEDLEDLANMTLNLVPKDIQKGEWAKYHQLTEKLNHLAMLCANKQMFDQAEKLLSQSLRIEELTLGPDDLNVARTLTNLAAVYGNQEGKYADAVPLFEQALKIRTKKLGPNHPEVASSLYNLALLYEGQDKLSKAEELYKKALSIYENAFGSDAPEVAMIVSALGSLHREQSRYIQAEPLFKRALAIYQKTDGPNHDATVAIALNNLAGLYYSQGKYQEAGPLYEQALTLYEKLQGTDHPDVATILNNLAVVYYKQGKFDKALPLLKQAVAIRERIMVPDHPAIAQSLNNLAEVYRSQKKFDLAQPLYERALSIDEKAFGRENREVANVLSSLGLLYEDKGDYTSAQQYYKLALDIRKKVLGPDSAEVANSLYELANLCLKQDQFAEAEPLFKQALAEREKILGPNHPDVATTLNSYATLMFKTNRYFEGIGMMARSLAIRSGLVKSA